MILTLCLKMWLLTLTWLLFCANLVVNSLSCDVENSSWFQGDGIFESTASTLETNTNNLSIVIENFARTYPVESWKQLGLFKESYLQIINVHWLKFPPPDKESHYALAGLYAFIMVFGLSGNAMVIFLIVRCQSLRTPANTLVVNLAVSDFLMMSKIPIFIINSIYRGPVMGDKACRYYGFIGGLSGTVSICSLAVISLDRYYVIKFPLNRRFTDLRVKIYVAVTWVYGIVFSIIPVLDVGLGTYVPEGYLTSCSFDYLTDNRDAKIFIWVFFVAAWVLPFALISFCYLNIIYVVILKNNIDKNHSSNGDSSKHLKKETKRSQEMRLTLVVFLIIALWFAAWTPYSVVALLGVLERRELIKPISSMVPALFCKTASCIDPFVYALTNQRFRMEFLKLFFNKPRKLKYFEYSRNSTIRSISGKRFAGGNQREDISMDMIMMDREMNGVEVQETNLDQSLQIWPHFNRSKKPWWYRQNFSNQSKSAVGIVRSLSTREPRKRASSYEG